MYKTPIVRVPCAAASRPFGSASNGSDLHLTSFAYPKALAEKSYPCQQRAAVARRVELETERESESERANERNVHV